MCGIFGYIGKENPLKTCIKGLKCLEYRGYDSAGVATIENGNILYHKEEGRIARLEEKLNLLNFKHSLAIGHTRWATHGVPSQKNAHPHLDYKSNLALVHNGIIENHENIRKMLLKKGISFSSDTDTEVMAQLISFHYKNDLVKALNKSLKQLKGSFAIALIHKDFPDQIIVASRESPISIGYDNKRAETLISSDPNAFIGKNLNILFLRNDEIAVINSKSVRVYDPTLKEVIKKTEKFNSKEVHLTKEGFEHFMLKEIYEQPHTIQKAFFGRSLHNEGTAIFENLNFDKKFLSNINHITITACGTSWHAASIGALYLSELANIPAQAEIASELRYKNSFINKNSLVIAISQSGETADTIASIRELKKKNAKVLSICNVKNSTITRDSDSSILLKAGPELSVCSTKAFTSQITVLFLFALFLARLRDMKKDKAQHFLKELELIPQKIKQTLKLNDEIKKLAEKYYKYEQFFYLGRHYMYPTSLEAALKLKEISYINANAYPAAEMKHGPLALINENLPVVAFCANKKTYDKMLSNIMETKARNAPVIAIAEKGSKEIEKIADDVIWVPKTIDELAIFPSTLAGQLFAYHIANLRKTDIDHPRNLAKSVTVE